ncbi:hypothetical protein [Kribbella deserti]|uniref:Uncharacterized protein n=1 Tax=Kribbella deserti TaxID=1926257 RepID=A0ABV6QKF3_9ACTN
MNELTRTVLEDFASWVESSGRRPVDLNVVADLCDVKAILLDQAMIEAGVLTEPDPRFWLGAATEELLRCGLYMVAVEGDWLHAVRRAMPLFFDYLATLDTAVVTGEELAGARAGFAAAFPADLHPKHPSAAALLGRLLVNAPDRYDDAETLSWAELEALAGPTLAPATLKTSHAHESKPSESNPGQGNVGARVPASELLGPATPVPVPSVLARLAEESDLMAQFIAVAREAASTGQRPDGVEDWIWRQVVVQALVGDPRLLAGQPFPGPSLRQWDSGRPELRVRVWSRAFQCMAFQPAPGLSDEAYPATTNALLNTLIAARADGRARIQDATGMPYEGMDPARLRLLVDRLQALGAVTVDDDTLTLTTLGYAGLPQLADWTGGSPPGALLIPSWSDTLVQADVVAVLNAVADKRASIDAPQTFPEVWLAHANPPQLADRLIDAMPWLTDPARDLAWTMLRTIGEPAAPAIRGCLDTWLGQEARAWLAAG